MPSVTAGQIILDAFGDISVTQLGDTITTLDAANTGASTDALRRLNLMCGQWSLNGLMTPGISRVVTPIVSGKGSPTNPYTIGSGGDINTTKPPVDAALVNAGLLLNASVPVPVEIPRGILTNDGYEGITVKDMTSTLFTNVYYQANYANDFGSIFLWPVPTDTVNSLVLYINAPLSTFADLTTSYYVPPGMDDALHYNLAKRLMTPYGRQIQEVTDMARETLAAIMRSNVPLSDLGNDFSSIGDGRRHIFNAITGE